MWTDPVRTPVARQVPGFAVLPMPGQEPSAGWQIVFRDYVDAIGMRVLSGRGFRDVDTAGSAPVVVVNETLARHAWGGRAARIDGSRIFRS